LRQQSIIFRPQCRQPNPLTKVHRDLRNTGGRKRDVKTPTAQIDERAFQKVCGDVNRMLGASGSEKVIFVLQRFEIARIAEKFPKGGTLLDVGCGYGFVARYFHELGAKVVSVDYPATGGFDALKALIDIGIEGHYVQVGIDPLPLADDSVDLVFVGNVIEHQPNSPKPFVADLKRVLKPGGHLVMDTKNAVDLKTRLKMLLGVSNWAPLMTYYELVINPHHHKEYTLSELTQLFKLAGFRNIEPIAFEFFFKRSLKKFRSLQAMGKKPEEVSKFGTGFNPLQPYEYARIFFLLLTKLFPNLRSEIMVIGQK
jgi:SAM-dependent methyltransferase